MSRSVFERHPRASIAGFLVVLLLLFVVAAEIALRKFSGLGSPVLFYAHPSYGYRLKPNQETRRFGGAHFKINNLGLRAQDDWGPGVEGRILFLGDSVTYGGNRISNEHLFSEVAARRLAGLRSGNAGIPNWGVENVYGLVVEEGFLPASIYVTTFIEDDFYRGLTAVRNRPWIKYRRPHLALQELAEFLWYRHVANTAEINRRERESEPPEARVERAARKLKLMDEFITAKGYRHLIFISPTRQQALGERARDARVKSALARHGIEARYLLDKAPLSAAPPDERRSWYQDNDHLTAKGHAVWGDMIHAELVRVLPARRQLVRTAG